MLQQTCEMDCIAAFDVSEAHSSSKNDVGTVRPSGRTSIARMSGDGNLSTSADQTSDMVGARLRLQCHRLRSRSVVAKPHLVVITR